MATAKVSQANMNGSQSFSRLGFRLRNGSFIFFWDDKRANTRKMVLTDNNGGQLRTGFLEIPADSSSSDSWKDPSTWNSTGDTTYEVSNFRGYAGGIFFDKSFSEFKQLFYCFG